jgi:hypothetical protein
MDYSGFELFPHLLSRVDANQRDPVSETNIACKLASNEPPGAGLFWGTHS